LSWYEGVGLTGWADATGCFFGNAGFGNHNILGSSAGYEKGKEHKGATFYHRQTIIFD